jgi:adenylate cyclase class IV
MKRASEKSLEIRGVIRKSCELFLAANTRTHLDGVESLGRFLEREVMQTEESGAAGHKKCRDMMDALDIDDMNLIDRAYIDMLEGRNS